MHNDPNPKANDMGQYTILRRRNGKNTTHFGILICEHIYSRQSSSFAYEHK